MSVNSHTIENALRDEESQPVISPERGPRDIHKPELVCPKCGGHTIFFNCEMHLPAFFCLSDVPMCNFYAEPESDLFREQMKQLTDLNRKTATA